GRASAPEVAELTEKLEAAEKRIRGQYEQIGNHGSCITKQRGTIKRFKADRDRLAAELAEAKESIAYNRDYEGERHELAAELAEAKQALAEATAELKTFQSAIRISFNGPVGTPEYRLACGMLEAIAKSPDPLTAAEFAELGDVLDAEAADHPAGIAEKVKVKKGGADVPAGQLLIALERKRQIDQEGWDAGHDDEQDEGQIARAAACYAAGQPIYLQGASRYFEAWPWDVKWDKRKQHTRLRQLVIAGALCAAEIDRLLRRSPVEHDHSGDANKKVEVAASAASRVPVGVCPLCGLQKLTKDVGDLNIKLAPSDWLCVHCRRYLCAPIGGATAPKDEPSPAAEKVEPPASEATRFVCPSCGGTEYEPWTPTPKGRKSVRCMSQTAQGTCGIVYDVSADAEVEAANGERESNSRLWHGGEFYVVMFRNEHGVPELDIAYEYEEAAQARCRELSTCNPEIMAVRPSRDYARFEKQLAAERHAREAAEKKSDAEMLRVKACEYIAEGELDWQRLRNECPSTAAVASLRDVFEAAEQRAERLQSRCNEHVVEIERLIQRVKELGAQIDRENDILRAKNFWRWQADGNDYPESLTCQVVMTAEQLRGLLQRAEQAEAAAGVSASVIQQALELCKEADNERLSGQQEAHRESAKWKAEGDMYGWNFHEGKAGGMNEASIIFYRVRRFIEAALAGQGEAAKEGR
ncbi:MAG: hypothetical protein KGL39_57465, partial [Patescibacteria group bacterium]|nr:hypothetical protein [Patescibacteria group bacterium]